MLRACGDNAVTIIDINSRGYQAADIVDLEAILAKRNENDANGFWLTHEDDEYPQLGVFVKEDHAYLHFIPKEYDAGFASVGMLELPKGQTIRFPISRQSGDDIYVL